MGNLLQNLADARLLAPRNEIHKKIEEPFKIQNKIESQDRDRNDRNSAK